MWLVESKPGGKAFASFVKSNFAGMQKIRVTNQMGNNQILETFENLNFWLLVLELLDH